MNDNELNTTNEGVTSDNTQQDEVSVGNPSVEAMHQPVQEDAGATVKSEEPVGQAATGGRCSACAGSGLVSADQICSECDGSGVK